MKSSRDYIQIIVIVIAIGMAFQMNPAEYQDNLNFKESYAVQLPQGELNFLHYNAFNKHKFNRVKSSFFVWPTTLVLYCV